MARIEIDPGDTKRIIHSQDAHEEYQCDVISGTGKIAHDRTLARQGNGTRILTGDRPTWRQLDGQELWAHAVEDSGTLILDVSGTHFEQDLQERSDDQAIATIQQINNNDPDLLEAVDAIATEATLEGIASTLETLETIEQNQQDVIDLLAQIEENTNGE